MEIETNLGDPSIKALLKKRGELLDKLNRFYNDEHYFKKDELYRSAKEKVGNRDEYYGRVREMQGKKATFLKRRDEIMRERAGSDPKKFRELTFEEERIQAKLSEIADEIATLLKKAQLQHVESRESYRNYDRCRDELERKYGVKDGRLLKEELREIDILLQPFWDEQRKIFSSLRKELIEYVLMCPFSDPEEIRGYMEEFSSVHNLYLHDDMILDTFHYSFEQDDPLTRPGIVYRTLSKINPFFRKWVEENRTRFFKNVVLGIGKSGYKVHDKREYEKFERDFQAQFELDPPTRREVLKTIIESDNSIKRIDGTRGQYEKVWSIFRGIDDRLFEELDERIKERTPRQNGL